MFELKWNECYSFDPGVVTQLSLKGMIESNKRVDLWYLKLAIASFYDAVLEQQSHCTVIQLLSWIIDDKKDSLCHILLQQLLQESLRSRFPLCHHSKEAKKDPRREDKKGPINEGMKVEIGGLLYAITYIPYQLDTHEEK
ncbi:hypothetical protein KI387_029997, partial [Taxus chinensis]